MQTLSPAPATASPGRTRAAVAKLATATLLFAFNPLLFGRIHLEPLELFWSANVLSALAVGAVLAMQRRLPELARVARARRGTLALLTFAFIGNNLLYIYALRRTTIANSVLTHYAAPALVFVLGALFLHERVSRATVIALGIAFAGLVLLVNPAAIGDGNRHSIGILFGLGSAVFYAQEIIFKKVLVTDHPALAIVFLYLALSIVVLAPFVSWTAISSMSSRDAALLALSGIGASAIGISLFMSGLQAVRAQQASVISYIEPLAAIVLAMLFLHEMPGVETLIGGALILGGTYLIVGEKSS